MLPLCFVASQCRKQHSKHVQHAKHTRKLLLGRCEIPPLPYVSKWFCTFSFEQGNFITICPQTVMGINIKNYWKYSVEKNMSDFEKHKKSLKLVILYEKDENALLIIHKFSPNSIYTKTRTLQQFLRWEQFETHMICKTADFKNNPILITVLS